MKQATFYLLDNAEPSGALSAHEAVACAVAANGFRSGKRVLIACESQEQAQRLDEALWQRPAA
ncbi:DNA polymerase III subunit chi [Pseudomonas aeruginosa]